jgi:hypothetical protein
VSARLVDGCGHPLQGAVVSFRVFGTNAPGAGQGGSGTTDSQGNSGFTYANIKGGLGTDQVQAWIKNPSGTLYSNAVSINWVASSSSAVGGPPGPGSALLSVITRLSVRPATFVPARSGPSALAVSRERRFGTVVTYHDSHPAITSVSVFKVVQGQKRGKSCVAAGKANRRAQACVRLVLVGYFTHDDVAGANRFRFTGRVRGHSLSPSNYVLQVVPHSSGGSGPMRAKEFRILHP